MAGALKFVLVITATKSNWGMATTLLPPFSAHEECGIALATCPE